ncbi:MAG: response regulator transcription factor [Candidatus Latescibacteria bacterium]|nr:response regulator transcription factor [Candidatus Latescibacterota bacterium]
MPTLLVVEDDTAIAKGLAHNLEFEGYHVLSARDGETGLRLSRERSVDLMILDIMLPRMNGFDVCRTMRAEGIRTPIIMLTAKGQEIDRVLGLELGADDYVTKPFSIRELLARIKAVIRRTTEHTPDLGRVRFGDVVLDFGTFEAHVRGREVHLSPKAFGVIKHLIQNEGRVVSRNELLDRVWGYDAFPTTRTVDNHVAELRAGLEGDPAHPEHILTVHGVGYKFVS